jgi:peptidoglycan/LPS O-acetylase OafA/YrhL
MTGTASDPTTSRSAGLDLLRAIACAIVVAFHLHTVVGVGFGPLDPIVDGGDHGVYIFFALSGYLLYRPFIGRAVDLRSYAIKRAGRILPGYYVALVALTLLTQSPIPLGHPLPYLAIASSYELPLRDFLGSAWTLSAEVLFYVTLPVIARLARGREVAVLSGLGILSVAWTIVLYLRGGEASILAMAAFPAVGYAFVPGMLLAVMESRHRATFVQLASWPYLILGGTFIVLGMVAHVLPIALGAGIGTPFVMGWLLQHRVPGVRALAFLGGASYAMYLWHKDMLLAFGIVGLPMALVGAAASWVIVERPILNWAHALTRPRIVATKVAATDGSVEAPAR